MRISMVSEHASPLAALGGVDAGGQNVHVAALSTALARRGHEVRVFTRRDNPATPERVQLAPGVEVVLVDAGPPERVPKDLLLPHMSAFADRLTEEWTAERPDVVHSHFWMSGVAALDAARREDITRHGRLPVVHTFHALGVVKRRHQGDEDTSPHEREWLEPWVGRSVDGVIATCSDEAFELKALGVPPHHISVTPCGVDLEHFTPAPGPQREPSHPRRIMTVSRLVKRKGVGQVVRALGVLRERGIDDVQLVIVGGAGADEPEAARLLALADELGVASQITVRGQVSQREMPGVLRSADVVVATPWYEPFGIVPLEAMACGVPVVVSSVGGLIDSVVDGVTGIHVPPREPEAIADALHSLLWNEKRMRDFGRNGRARVEKRYSWGRVAADTARAYRNTVHRSTRDHSAADHGTLDRLGPTPGTELTPTGVSL